jgi:hypothetical protein
MKFKDNSDRLKKEWESPKLAPMVKKIVEDAAEFARTKFNWEFTITSIFRSKAEDAALHASGIHVEWRAVDVRSRGIDQEAVNKVAEFINKKYAYDPNRPGMKVCFKEPHGNGVHAHYQVHPNTKKR